MLDLKLKPNQNISSKRTIFTKATVKNTAISPNFLVWKFCGKAQFPHSFGQFWKMQLHPKKPSASASKIENPRFDKSIQ